MFLCPNPNPQKNFRLMFMLPDMPTVSFEAQGIRPSQLSRQLGLYQRGERPPHQGLGKGSLSPYRRRMAGKYIKWDSIGYQRRIPIR